MENNYLGQPILNQYATNLKSLYMFRRAYYKILEVIINSHMMF